MMPLDSVDRTFFEYQVGRGEQPRAVIDGMLHERYVKAAGRMLLAYINVDISMLTLLTLAKRALPHSSRNIPSQMTERLKLAEELVPDTDWPAELKDEITELCSLIGSASATRNRMFHWVPVEFIDAVDPIVRLVNVTSKKGMPVRETEELRMSSIDAAVVAMTSAGVRLALVAKKIGLSAS